MKLLIVNGDLPTFPGQAGNEYFHTVRLPKLTERVGLVSLLHTPEQDDKKRGLSDAGVALYLWRSPALGRAPAPAAPPPGWRRRLAEAVYNGVRNWRRHPADTMIQDFQFRNIAGPLLEALGEAAWDAVIVVQSNCARWLDYMPRPALSVLVMHDVRALVYERRAAAAGSTRERLAFAREARRYRRFEGAYCRRFDLVVTVSPADEAWVRARYRPRRLVTVALPIDRSYFHPLRGIEERAERILFTGMMAHPPNVDAAQFFARDVLPLVRRRRPDAEFWIVGRDVTPPVAQLAALPGVVVTGFVPDMRPYIAQAGVVVVPLRYGSGMRNKILEAWAMEKCVVSTSVGAEGLEYEDGVNLLVADGAASLADRVVAAMSDAGLRDRVRARGQAVVTASHDPDMLAERYVRAIEAARTEEAAADGHLRAVIDLRWMRPGVAGGIENLSRSFLGELLRLDAVNRYTVLLPAQVRYDLDTRERDNVRLVAADGPRELARRAMMRALRRLHARLRLHYWRTPDVETLERAHAMDADVALSVPGYIRPDLDPLINVLVVPDIQHEYCPEFFAPGELEERRRIYTQSARRAAHICAISEFTRQTLIERLAIDPERITTTPLAADPLFEPGSPARGHHQDVLARYGLPPGEYLFYPGNTWPHKNHEVAVRALRALYDGHGLDPLLVLTGSPRAAQGRLLEQIHAEGLGDRVRFLGYCPVEDMPALYEGAAALVFPSLFEGFGIPLVEAMWCECPIVSSNASSLPEIAGDAALLVDPRSPEQLAEAVARVLTDKAERQRLTERGQRRAREFSWARFTLAVIGALRRARWPERA